MATLMQKLQLKDGNRVALLNASAEINAHFCTELPNITITDSADASTDAFILFATTSDELAHFTTVEKSLKKEAMIWIAYPKKSSKIETNLNRDKGWEAINTRWEGVRLISLDANWSILRWKPKVSKAELLAAQYAKKAALRPIFDKIAATVLSWDGVTQHVRKNYVAFINNKQFARVHASTKTRVDLVLALKEEPFDGRLEDAGRLGDSSFTHKVVLKSAEDVDDQVFAWIEQARAKR